MNSLENLLKEYAQLTSTLDAMVEKWGIEPSENDLRQVAYLAKRIKALGGRV